MVGFYLMILTAVLVLAIVNPIDRPTDLRQWAFAWGNPSGSLDGACFGRAWLCLGVLGRAWVRLGSFLAVAINHPWPWHLSFGAAVIMALMLLPVARMSPLRLIFGIPFERAYAAAVCWLARCRVTMDDTNLESGTPLPWLEISLALPLSSNFPSLSVAASGRFLLFFNLLLSLLLVSGFLCH